MKRLSFNLGQIPGVTMLFAGSDLGQRLATAHAHWFTGVEGQVPADLAGMRALLREHDMQYVCMSFARGDTGAGELGITALAGREQEFRQQLSAALRAAEELSCGMIHPMAGRVEQGPGREAAWDVYRKNLRIACTEAAKQGVRVIVEPICAARQPQYVFNTLAQAMTLLESVSPELLVMADMFHAHMSGESVSAFARQHARSIGLFQVSNAPERRQPSPDDPELLATIRALQEQAWTGWYSGEYVPEGELSTSLAWTRVVPEA